MAIRHANFASKFYPANAQMLRQSILGFLENVPNMEVPGKIKAIVVPHGGYIFSGQVAAYGYKLLKGLNQDTTWKVLVMGPEHELPINDAAVPIQYQWETPLGLVQAKDIRQELLASENIVEIPNIGSEEHSIEVQVPFLQMCLEKFYLYPLYTGSVRPDFLSQELMQFCQQDDALTIVSTDLSHYYDYETARVRDYNTSKSLEHLHITDMTKGGDACGKRAILTLMYIARKMHWKVKMLEYKNSGDTAGDMGRVVGYGTFVFYE